MSQINIVKKLNSTIILLIILIILLGGYFGWQYLKDRISKEIEQLVFGNIDTSQISKIEISQKQADKENITTLDLKDNQWLVTSQSSLPADQTIVSNILTILPTVKIKELVSTNPFKQLEYAVDSTGLHVKIYRGENILFNFYAGKNGPVVSTSYFRWDGSEKVYLILENLQILFSRSDWADKKFLTIDKSNVTKITWQYPSYSFSLEKIDNKWQINNQEIQDEKVDNFLNSLSNLSAQKVIWAKESIASVNDLILTIDQIKLYFNKVQGDYSVRKDGDNREFTIDSYLYQQIAKRASEFN